MALLFSAARKSYYKPDFNQIQWGVFNLMPTFLLYVNIHMGINYHFFITAYS